LNFDNKNKAINHCNDQHQMRHHWIFPRIYNVLAEKT